MSSAPTVSVRLPPAAAAGGALARIAGGLVVSCQASAGSPLRDTAIMQAMARAAELGGAVGLRLEGFADIAAIRPQTSLPIIGLVKQAVPDSDVYITPTSALARRLCRMGCEIVAFDATTRNRPEPVETLCATIRAEGRLSMADISTLPEALAALAAGADIVGTTLAGYTPYSTRDQGPDLALMRALAAAGRPFIAEGRVRSPAEAASCLAAGAWCVVVGSAITRPDEITRWYVDALQQAAPLQNPS